MHDTDNISEIENKLIWQKEATPSDRNVRLDKFWGTALENEGVSRGKIKDWIKAGLAEIDGKVCKKPNQKLIGNETLSIKGECETTSLIPDDSPLEILFNDGRIVIINKPAGLTTHPAPSCPTDTLVHRLIHHFPEIKDMDEWRPGIIHRLDKFTSGLIAVALNEHDRLTMSAAFADREVDKAYLAIVHGTLPNDFGEIDEPIGRHPIHKTKMAIVHKGGRPARSSYEVLWSDPAERASLLKVKIYTGRTHQIRVHMAHLGNPLVGDQVYGAQHHHQWINKGKPLADMAERQMLHAYNLSFNHPESDENLSFTKTPPKDFTDLLEELNRSVQRVGLIGMPCSGKSAVLDILKKNGVPVFCADKSVANSYSKGSAGWEMICQRFGNRFVDSDSGDISKTKLFATMRDDEPLRREIMNIIHPIVQHEAEEFFKENAAAPFAVAEVPLLLEAGWHSKKIVDAVIGVRCPTEKRTGELREKRNLDPEILAVFDSWQWDEKSKMDCCTTVIENNSDLDNLKSETSNAMDQLAKIRNNKEIIFKKFLAELFTPQSDQ
ncbi:dephospho-CoA kinase [Maridesulfovibrio zosterae]|uniref:dephospho-CoA kinase n=1 Tax=Maridesulfovibrio zosterae TaxID=82171 RepID=UPI00041D800D|nr:dephospho-CoA kinase [Maridesulfovibrio zosterae]